ncbi:uncharacterized protein F5Z01DRAFT_163824 [Emericellopsis atlantica]|uniref:ABM domain-containing protein n=1 Tax=Emericellopsis atlantica TaxID=2614577 RepID=A0A9P8CQ37_9HYPO|nr:uncharacterized protein F5Z01DRAFT_163824 [Emericellopsis atlantica]KAG9253351.1 hypothetical protein F5Z01DRAFT_163824 [Emericellopsis atlantica]
MPHIDLTAIITPKSPEKGQRFLGLFQECVDYVEANEKDYVHRYEMHKGIKDKNGKEQYVVLEGYKDKEGLDKHMKSKPVVELLEAISKEDLTETQIIMTTKGPGIAPKL